MVLLRIFIELDSFHTDTNYFEFANDAYYNFHVTQRIPFRCERKNRVNRGVRRAGGPALVAEGLDDLDLGPAAVAFLSNEHGSRIAYRVIRIMKKMVWGHYKIWAWKLDAEIPCIY